MGVSPPHWCFPSRRRNSAFSVRRRPTSASLISGTILAGCRAFFDFADAGLHHLRHEPVGKGLIGGKLDRALTQQIVLELSGVGLRDTVANSIQGVMRLPVAKVGDRLPFELVANDAVAHAFGCLRRSRLDRLSELLQGCVLLLRCRDDVIVDGLHTRAFGGWLLRGHWLASTTQKRLPSGSARMT